MGQPQLTQAISIQYNIHPRLCLYELMLDGVCNTQK